MSLKTTSWPLLIVLGIVPFAFLIARYTGQSEQQQGGLAPAGRLESGDQGFRKPTDLSIPARAGTSREESSVIDGSEGLQPTEYYEESSPVELRDGELWVGAELLSSVRIESWPREPLYRLIKDVQSIQIESMRDFMESYPTEHLFISNAEYTKGRLWHEDTVFHTTKRIVVNSDGEEVEEFGRIAVPRDLHPDGYLLRSAIVRAYRAPQYARYLATRGSEYEAKIFADYPDATSDVTSDLTHWTYFDSHGVIVGAMSFPRNGNN